MPDRVVITRPLAQARPLAERVAATGRDAVIFPLLDISPLAEDSALRAVLSNLQQYEMVAFVSPNAIDAVFRIVDSWPAQVALAVVGEGSRQALAHHGLTDATARIFRPKDTGRADSEALLETLDLSALKEKQILVVRGETGRELLSDTLRDAGAQVTQIAAYRRSAPLLDEARREQLRDLLDGDSTWIVTSSEAVRNLVDMVEAIGGRQALEHLRSQHLLVPHIRIEETARLLDFRHVILTGSGDESLIAALQCSP